MSVKLREPITVQLRVRPPASLSALEDVPGVSYRDGEVTFTATSKELWSKIGRIVFIGAPHYGSTSIAGYLKNMPKCVRPS